MRLGVDARVLVHRPTGVARYLRGILSRLREVAGTPLHVTCYTDREVERPLPGAPERVRALRWPLPGGDPAWRQLRLAAHLRGRPPDVLFCPFYTLPLLDRTPAALTIHDVAYLAHPAWFDARGRLAFRLVAPSARRARRVLTPSRFSADEIVRRLGVAASKIVVTPLAIDEEWRRPVEPERRRAARAWLGVDGPFVLHLGAVHERRLPATLVRALVHLRGDARLVVAGPTLPPAPDVVRLAEEIGVAERLIRREWVPEEHLRGLVAEADAVVYLSLYEGFGLPALEAAALGTPVVALERASLPEVLGAAALWIGEPEPKRVGEALAELVADERARADLAREGLRQSARFSWRKTAEETWRALLEAARSA